MLKGTKVGYKVVSVTSNGKLLSWKAGGEYNRVGLFGNVEYTEGDWTLRVVNDGPLTVFDTYKNALDFEIYYRPSVRGLRFKIFKVVYMPSKSSRLWFGGVDDELCMDSPYGQRPSGTQFADAIFLMKEVLTAYENPAKSKEIG